MSNSQLKAISNKVTLNLPSKYQFYTLSLLNYTEFTLKKIELHLNSNQTEPEPTYKAKYFKLSNQELKRRSNFLQIVYELIQVYDQFSSQISPRTLEQLSKVNSCIILSIWLQKLRLTNDQLSKITSLKTNIEQGMKIEPFNQKLIPLLFQTQIYIFQIMIRLIIIQKIYCENDKYNNQLRKLKNRFNAPHEREGKREQTHAIERVMSKSSEMKCKENFKEINKIITFYQLEISTNRPDCRAKPQIQYLLELVKQKFNKDFAAQILRKTELGNFNLHLKQTKKNQMFPPFVLDQGNSKNLQEVQESQTNTQYQKSLKDQDSKKIDSIKLQNQEFASVYNEESTTTCSQSNDLVKQKLQKQMKASLIQKEDKKAVQLQSSSSQNSKNKTKRESAVSLYLKQKQSKHEILISDLSHYKKLQYISNNQRFSSKLNLQNKLFKPKIQNFLYDSSFSQQITQHNERLRRQTIAKQNRALHKADLLSQADETLQEKTFAHYEQKQNQ